MSMTNDENIIQDTYKLLAGIGNIFFENVDLKKTIPVSKEINNYIFDTGTHNFHMIPDLSQKETVEKYTRLIGEIRKKIIEELTLSKKVDVQIIDKDEYKDFTKIEHYDCNKIYIYEKGGKDGTLASLTKKKVDDNAQARIKKEYRQYGYNAIFKYIPCMVNGIYYSLNFMRFYIDKEKKVNCIYQNIQFERANGMYLNEKSLAYPTAYRSMEISRVNKLAKSGSNFCFNPQVKCEIKNIKKIAELFVEFIDRCRISTEKQNQKHRVYIVKKNNISFSSPHLLKLNRTTKHLEYYRLSTDNTILHDYYPIRKDFDSSDYLMYEKEKEFPCIWGGGDTPTPEGIFQIEKVSEAHEEYVSGYYTGHDKVKFFGYLVVFEDYFIHSNLYTEEATQDTFEQMKPVNGAEEHSSGCIRLAQEDLDWLVENVEVGTIVVM